MTGAEMLLKPLLDRLGIDPEQIKAHIEAFKHDLPIYARGLAEQVQQINARQAAIEAKLDLLIARLPAPGITAPAPTPDVTVPTRANGVCHD